MKKVTFGTVLSGYFVILLCISILFIMVFLKENSEQQRRVALTASEWVGSDGYSTITFFPDGSADVDRANSEMVGSVVITGEYGSTVEGYYRVHHKCTRIFVFDRNDIRYGTFVFDGETLEAEGGYTYTGYNQS